MTTEVEVPFELHRYIIGQKGSGIRKMMDEFEASSVNLLGFVVRLHALDKVFKDLQVRSLYLIKYCRSSL